MLGTQLWSASNISNTLSAAHNLSQYCLIFVVPHINIQSILVIPNLCPCRCRLLLNFLVVLESLNEHATLNLNEECIQLPNTKTFCMCWLAVIVLLWYWLCLLVIPHSKLFHCINLEVPAIHYIISPQNILPLNFFFFFLLVFFCCCCCCFICCNLSASLYTVPFYHSLVRLFFISTGHHVVADKAIEAVMHAKREASTSNVSSFCYDSLDKVCTGTMHSIGIASKIGIFSN